MPFINIKTNTAVSAGQGEALKSALGASIGVIPGKSEDWLMVNIEDSCRLYFRGTAEPAVIAQVQIYGSPSKAAMSALTGKITEAVGALGISPGRVYVSYMCTDDWGFNGSNF